MLRGLAAFADPLGQNLGSLVLNLWDANPGPKVVWETVGGLS
jgi:hypothetical protein